MNLLRASSAVFPEISFLSFGKARLDDSSSERQSKSPSESGNEIEIPLQEKQRASSGLQNPSANTMGSFQLLRLFQFQTSQSMDMLKTQQAHVHVDLSKSPKLPPLHGHAWPPSILPPRRTWPVPIVCA